MAGAHPPGGHAVVPAARDRHSAMMTLTLQALPLVALTLLLASGRVGPVSACLLAMLACLPAAVLLLPGPTALPGFLLTALLQGGWLALVPVGVIAGGLVFHAAIPERQGGTPIAGTVGDTLFTAAFLLGPFTETVTGFGVGLVFCLGVMRRAGVGGLYAAMMALIAQLFIPWGGLGPGTTIGAALADIPATDLATASAWITATVLLLMLPAFWYWCGKAGHQVPMRSRLAQVIWVLATDAALILAHRVAPWELCGALATGVVLAVRLLLAAPPRSAAALRHALAAASPYLLLIGVLLGSRLYPSPPRWQPLPEMAGLPANHAMFGIWLAALLQLARGQHALPRLADALRRARRPAIVLLMFVLFSRLISNAGVPQGLARALAALFGHAAPFAAPLLAGLGGFLAGTNVGANSAMMPLQAELGRLAGLSPVLLPSVQNGTAFLLISPQLTAIAAAVAGDGATQAKIWRLCWPIPLAALLVGLAVIALG